MQNKLISWSYSRADRWEFHDNGQLVAIGGQFPLEGCRAMVWESLNENGSFKIVFDPAEPHDFFAGIFEEPIDKNKLFRREKYLGGEKVTLDRLRSKIYRYEELQSSKSSLASTGEARVVLTRFMKDVYTLEPIYVDRLTEVEKVVVNGGPYGVDEVLFRDGNTYRVQPPTVLSKELLPEIPFAVTMTLYLKGQENRQLHFEIGQYWDRSGVEFDDPWF
ncbi:MAG: hypothetical protein ABFS19_11195 [Thermodesulfobacteriota bacterium]